MKKRISFIVILALIMCMSALFACTAEPTYEVGSESLKIWLDRYDEADVVLVKGDKNALTWTSADERIVTVDKGRVIAQGKGVTTVTVADKKFKTDIAVTVRDSKIPPRLDFTEINAYLDNEVKLPQYVKYGAKTYESDLQYSVNIEDSSFASFTDNRIKGLKLGVTKADIETSYKGLTLRQTVTVNVKEPLSVVLDDEQAEIYNVNNKKGKYNIDSAVTWLGEKVNVTPKWQITSGAEYIRLDGDTVVAVAEGEAVVETAVEYNGKQAEASVKIIVHPDFIPTEFAPSGEENIVWEQTTETIGDRSGNDYVIMKYQPDDNIGKTDADGDHIYSQRVEERKSGELLTKMYADGIRYFAYDLYFDCSDPYLMVGCGPYYDWILANSYFRSDYFTILSADQGKKPEVINVLQTKRWITLVYDIKALWMNSLNLESKFFFFVNKHVDGEYQYLCNPRYSLSDEFIPSENIVRVKKDGYIQATCDEFDPMTPVQPADKVPSYGICDEQIGGRENVYKYVAHTSVPLNNAMIAAASNGLGYDAAMYELKKLGSHLTFDIYPEKCTDISFYLNYLGLSAKFEIGKTNTLEYDKWLTVIADGKIQSVIQPGRWQTISIAYLDNYDETAAAASIMFAACNAGDVIYIDNVRYMPDDGFIPDKYEEEAVRPVLSDNTIGVTLERELSGAYAWSYKYTNPTTGNEASSVRFITVEEGGEFFRAGYQYVKFDMFVTSDVTSVTLKAAADKNVTAYEKTLTVGQPFTGADIFDVDGRKVDTLQADAWYTVYIPVRYTNAETGNVDVSVRTDGGTADKPAVAYIRYLNFAYDVNGLFTRDYYDSSDLYSVEYQTSGEYAGSWKYINTHFDYGESGIAFDRVTSRNNERAGAFFKDGYHWIKVDFLVKRNVKTFAIRVSGAATNTIADYWKQNIPVDADIDATEIYAVDEKGNRASRIATGKWYTLYIPIEYTSVPPADSYVMVSVYFNGGSAAAPAEGYFKNIEYLKETPAIPEAKPFPYSTWQQYYPDLMVYVGLSWNDDGSVLYTCKKDSDGETGLCLSEGFGNAAYSKYKYARMEFSVGANTQNISFRMKGDTANSFSGEYWVQAIPVGSDFGGESYAEYVYLYDESGNRVTMIERDTRYVIYLPYTTGDNWDTVYLGGGTTEAPAHMSIYGVTYTESRPKAPKEIPYGVWYPDKKTVTLSWSEDGTYVLFTCTDETQDSSGFYLKEWQDNKAEYSKKYKYARMSFSVGANTSTISFRMKGDNVNSFSGEYWVQAIPVGSDFGGEGYAENVYIYDENGNRVTLIERDTRYVVYLPVTESDNWNDVYANGGSAEAPAHMSIYEVTYTESLPKAPKEIPYGVWYPDKKTVTLSWSEDGTYVLFTCTDETQDSSGFYLKEWYDNKAEYSKKYKYARMSFSVGANTSTISFRMKGDNVNSFSGEYWVQAIPVGSDFGGEGYAENVYIYDENGNRVTLIERDTRYVVYLPVTESDNWNDVYANGGSAEAPAHMSIYEVTYTESRPEEGKTE